MYYIVDRSFKNDDGSCFIEREVYISAIVAYERFKEVLNNGYEAHFRFSYYIVASGIFSCQ